MTTLVEITAPKPQTNKGNLPIAAQTREPWRTDYGLTRPLSEKETMYIRMEEIS